jgi:hypothetical protein
MLEKKLQGKEEETKKLIFVPQSCYGILTPEIVQKYGYNGIYTSGLHACRCEIVNNQTGCCCLCHDDDVNLDVIIPIWMKIMQPIEATEIHCEIQDYKDVCRIIENSEFKSVTISVMQPHLDVGYIFGEGSISDIEDDILADNSPYVSEKTWFFDHDNCLDIYRKAFFGKKALVVPLCINPVDPDLGLNGTPPLLEPLQPEDNKILNIFKYAEKFSGDIKFCSGIKDYLQKEQHQGNQQLTNGNNNQPKIANLGK